LIYFHYKEFGESIDKLSKRGELCNRWLPIVIYKLTLFGVLSIFCTGLCLRGFLELVAWCWFPLCWIPWGDLWMMMFLKLQIGEGILYFLHYHHLFVLMYIVYVKIWRKKTMTNLQHVWPSGLNTCIISFICCSFCGFTFWG
jgi:hypothetical protein